ncbi:hypothetical protein ACTWPT_41210 [Nonomuraea sp. 3N208]|uniref:rhamnogalacturonan endolyase family protein n=1 Tax=Nonomuraea sp. 3N208 TaxID=3457421 RepID=UPI003FD3720A
MPLESAAAAVDRPDSPIPPRRRRAACSETACSQPPHHAGCLLKTTTAPAPFATPSLAPWRKSRRCRAQVEAQGGANGWCSRESPSRKPSTSTEHLCREGRGTESKTRESTSRAERNGSLDELMSTLLRLRRYIDLTAPTPLGAPMRPTRLALTIEDALVCVRAPGHARRRPDHARDGTPRPCSVATTPPGGIFLSWPFLGIKVTGAGTGGRVGAGFSVYREGRPIATVADSTNYLEPAGTPASKYAVAPIVRGKEGRKHSRPRFGMNRFMPSSSYARRWLWPGSAHWGTPISTESCP